MYLYHYTSIEALTNMLHIASNEEKESIEANDNESAYGYYLTFHASDARMMNDKVEHLMSLNILENSITKKLKSKYLVETLFVGNPFVISFSTERDYTPMWQIYAKENSGICLKFDFREENFRLLQTLNKNEITTQEDIFLDACKYQTIKEIRISIRETLKKLEDNITNDSPKHPLLDLYRQSALYKGKEWAYEKEWRIVLWHNYCNIKQGKYGILPFQTIKIPLRFLKEILIGPGENQELVRYGLESWVKANELDKLSKYKIDFDINISNSTLRR